MTLKRDIAIAISIQHKHTD